MTPEEFQKLKEAEKEHLTKLRKLKTAVRKLKRQRKVTSAVDDMTSSIKDKMDEHQEMVERLAMDAARTEARLEVALEAVDEEIERKAVKAEDEETLREIRARELISKIKNATDPLTTSSVKSDERVMAEADPDTASGGEKSPGKSSSERPEQSQNSESSQESSSLPEKTIGRMKP